MAPVEPDAADGISEFVLRARDLLRSVLRVSEAGLEAARPVSLNGTASRLEPLLRRLVRGKGELGLDLGQVPMVRARASDLELVLVNLCTNSIRALSKEGRIRISTYCVSSSTGFRAVLEVSDNGCGVDPQMVREIFKPQVSTAPSTHTGLGLAIVESLVSEMNGVVEIDSAPQVGTSVRIVLPALATE